VRKKFWLSGRVISKRRPSKTSGFRATASTTGNSSSTHQSEGLKHAMVCCPEQMSCVLCKCMLSTCIQTAAPCRSADEARTRCSCWSCCYCEPCAAPLGLYNLHKTAPRTTPATRCRCAYRTAIC
jgi:hypothetical protein